MGIKILKIMTINGIVIKKIQEICGATTKAITKEKININGALTAIRIKSIKAIWILLISVVCRVIKDEDENLSML